MPRTFYMITLGCPKNRVDAEMVWAAAASGGLLAVDDPADADVIVVNTCAFIQSAVSESLDAIVDLGRYKREGRCKRLLVAGCLPARYGESLVAELPEVDLFVGPSEAGRLGGWMVEDRLPGKLASRQGEAYLAEAGTPRANSLAAGAAYLKVAEGCGRRCAFCIIPKLRGPQRSRSLEDLVAEAEALARLGVAEIVLIAQDLASWGRDLPGQPELADLVSALAGVAGLWWLRLMYLFPVDVPERLIRVIADNDTVLPYLDLPFQHADPEVLRRMRRGGDPDTFTSLVQRLREDIPGVVLRSTLMTGFPGEDEAAYEKLRDFAERCRFERLGVFTFSPEEGTEAATMPDPVPAEVAARRRDELMVRQREIASAYHQSLVGQSLEVLVEEELADGAYAGRAWNQAPEVDGRTMLAGWADAGDVVRARVTGGDAYDLEAKILT